MLSRIIHGLLGHLDIAIDASCLAWFHTQPLPFHFMKESGDISLALLSRHTLRSRSDLLDFLRCCGAYQLLGCDSPAIDTLSRFDLVFIWPVLGWPAVGMVPCALLRSLGYEHQHPMREMVLSLFAIADQNVDGDSWRELRLTGHWPRKLPTGGKGVKRKSSRCNNMFSTRRRWTTGTENTHWNCYYISTLSSLCYAWTPWMTTISSGLLDDGLHSRRPVKH